MKTDFYSWPYLFPSPGKPPGNSRYSVSVERRSVKRQMQVSYFCNEKDEKEIEKELQSTLLRWLVGTLASLVLFAISN